MAKLKPDDPVVSPTESEPDVLRHVRQQIEAAASELDADELPPSEEAEAAVMDWLRRSAVQYPSGSAFPDPFVEGRGDGAIYVEWRGRGRNLVALVAPNGSVNLYRLTIQGGRVADQQVLPSPSAEATVDALIWVADPSVV